MKLGLLDINLGSVGVRRIKHNLLGVYEFWENHNCTDSSEKKIFNFVDLKN